VVVFFCFLEDSETMVVFYYTGSAVPYRSIRGARVGWLSGLLVGLIFGSR
jgi:hypothetical protein